MPLSKKQIAAKQEITLEDNVRLLRCGSWGYIYKKVAILKTKNAETCNSFSIWVENYLEFANKNKFDKHEIKHAIQAQALIEQQAEPKFQILPQCHLCDAPHWYANGDNYGAVIRQQSLMTNK
jgi:hypothetical protein